MSGLTKPCSADRQCALHCTFNGAKPCRLSKSVWKLEVSASELQQAHTPSNQCIKNVVSLSVPIPANLSCLSSFSANLGPRWAPVWGHGQWAAAGMHTHQAMDGGSCQLVSPIPGQVESRTKLGGAWAIPPPFAAIIQPSHMISYHLLYRVKFVIVMLGFCFDSITHLPLLQWLSHSIADKKTKGNKKKHIYILSGVTIIMGASMGRSIAGLQMPYHFQWSASASSH